MGSLSNLFISQSYISLIHLGSNNTASSTPIELEDGLGNGLGVSVSTNKNLYVSGNIYATNLTGSGGSVDTSSLVTTASFNAYTASQDFKNTTFATTGSNTFVGNQTINGNVNITGSLTASGLKYPLIDNGAKSFVQTDGNGNLSLQYVQTVYETVRNTNSYPIVKGAPLFASGSTGDNANVFYADASDSTIMPAVYIAGEDLAPGATGLAIVGGLIEGVNTTGFPAGTIVYVAEGGGWSANRPSGSNSVVQVLGVVQKEGVGGQGVVINQLEAVLPNIQEGYAWVGNGTNQPVAVATSSFGTPINTASFATTGSNTFVGNQTINGVLQISSSATYDLDITGGFQATGNSRVSSSFGSSNITGNGLGYTSATASIQSNLTKGSVTSQDTTGAPTDFRSIAIQANPSVTGNSSMSSITVPSIVTQTGTANVLIAPIQFQHRSTYTDGRVTITTPLSASAGLIGDTYISNGALQVSTFPNVSKQWFEPTAIEAIGTASVAYEQFVNDGGYDAFNVVTNLNAGTEFRDLPSDTFVLNTWLAIPQNTGNNPAPQFKRGLGVTGSANFEELTGSLGAFSASISNRINNVSGSGGTIDTSSFATTGSNNFVGNQTINGAVQISSSATYDLDITGGFQATAASRVSSSIAISNISPTFVQTISGSFGIGASSIIGRGYTQATFNTNTITMFASGGTGIGAVSTAPLGSSGIAINSGSSANAFYYPIIFQPSTAYTDGRVTFTTPIQANSEITASKILLTNTGTSTAIQYNQQSSGSVPGLFATSYGRDNLKIYQYQSQPYAFNLNLNVDTINPYTGSQFKWGLQVNGSDVSIPGGGGTYFSMVSGSTTGSGQPGQDKLGLDYLGTSMILDMNADTSFRRKVYVDKGMFVSQSQGGGVTALTVDGTSAASSRALVVTGSVDITGSLTLNGNQITSLAAGAFFSTQTQSGSSAVSQSMTFNNTSVNEGVSVNSNTQLTVTNSGTYNIQFSAQLLADTGADTIYIWLKKNGSNVSNSATKLVLANNEGNVAAWNFVENANANDYFELCWESANGDAVLLAENSSGNVPSIPSVIATVTQVN
jgi:hypothetical protein